MPALLHAKTPLRTSCVGARLSAVTAPKIGVRSAYANAAAAAIAAATTRSDGIGFVFDSPSSLEGVCSPPDASDVSAAATLAETRIVDLLARRRTRRVVAVGAADATDDATTTATTREVELARRRTRRGERGNAHHGAHRGDACARSRGDRAHRARGGRGRGGRHHDAARVLRLRREEGREEREARDERERRRRDRERNQTVSCELIDAVRGRAIYRDAASGRGGENAHSARDSYRGVSRAGTISGACGGPAARHPLRRARAVRTLPYDVVGRLLSFETSHQQQCPFVPGSTLYCMSFKPRP